MAVPSRPLLLSAALLGLAAGEPPPVAPEHPAAGDGTITVTVGDRHAYPLDRTTASVVVADEAEAKRRGRPLSWWALLDGLPGIDAQPNNGSLAGSGDIGLSIRGIGSRDIQIRVDGIPVGDPTSTDGSANPGLAIAPAIDRIEVAKGAQSGLYGSGAVGGVVAIATRDPGEAWRGSARVEAGSFRTVRTELSADGPINGWLGTAVAASILRSRGYSARSGPEDRGDPSGHEADSVEQGSAQAKLVAAVAPGWKLSVGVRGTAANDEYDESAFDPATFESVPLPDDDASMVRNRGLRVQAGAAWTRGTGRLRIDAARTWQFRTYTPADAPTSRYDAVDDYAGATASTAWSAGPLLCLTASGGGDVRAAKAEIDDQRYLSALTKRETIGGLWGSLGGGNRHLEASATARQDWHSREGDIRTWRVGIGWWPLALATADPDLEDLVKLRAASGTAFRAPSLYELHSSYGDPGLEAQRSRSGEVGADLVRAGWGSIGATAFRTRYETLIDYDFAVNAYGNVEGVAVRGTEIAATLAPDCCGLRAKASYQRLRDNAEGAGLPRQPSRRWVVDLGWQWSAVWVGGRAERAASRYWNPGFGPESGLAGYTLYSANARWQIDPVWAVYARGENLGDERYVRSPGFSTQPRSLFAGVEAAF